MKFPIFDIPTFTLARCQCVCVCGLVCQFSKLAGAFSLSLVWMRKLKFAHSRGKPFPRYVPPQFSFSSAKARTIFILKIIFALINSHRFQFSRSFFPSHAHGVFGLKCPADNKCYSIHFSFIFIFFIFFSLLSLSIFYLAHTFATYRFIVSRCKALVYPSKMSDFSISAKTKSIKMNEMFALIDYNFDIGSEKSHKIDM